MLNLDSIPTKIIYERLIGSESRNNSYNFFESKIHGLRITYNNKVPNELGSSNENHIIKQEKAKYTIELNFDTLSTKPTQIITSNNIKVAFLECDQNGKINSIQLKLTNNSVITLRNKNSESNNIFVLSSDRSTSTTLDKNNLNQITNSLIQHTKDIIAEHLKNNPDSVNLKLKDAQDLKREQETIESLSNPDLSLYSKNVADYLLKITSRSNETKRTTDNQILNQEFNINLPFSNTNYQIRTTSFVGKIATLTTSFQISDLHSNSHIKYEYDGMGWKKFETSNNYSKENKTLLNSDVLDELKSHLINFANYIYRY